jgi:hypothetical protein
MLRNYNLSLNHLANLMSYPHDLSCDKFMKKLEEARLHATKSTQARSAHLEGEYRSDQIPTQV